MSIRFANAKSSEAPSAGATLSHIGRSFSSNLLSEVMFPSYRHIRRIVYVYIIIYIWSMENSRIVVLCTVYDNCWKQMTQTLVQRRWGVSAGKNCPASRWNQRTAMRCRSLLLGDLCSRCQCTHIILGDKNQHPICF